MVGAGFQCLSMALPMVLMLAWRSGAVPGQTGDWFNWSAKLVWLKTALREKIKK